MLHMLALAYRIFGFGDRFELVLSTRPDNFIGAPNIWERAESDLKAALEASGRPWSLNVGDGAFYGPKIDIRLVDAMGRKHQTATIQLDFQLPERFQLEYAQSEADGGGVARPVMIHRAILGSFERFLAILIEQCKGWWPFWLSPRQAVVIPAYASQHIKDCDAIKTYATHVQQYLAGGADAPHASDAAIPLLNPFAKAPEDLSEWSVPERTRFQVDLPAQYAEVSGVTLGKKVRQAQLARYNFIVIVGSDEVESHTVNLRLREERAAPAWIADDSAEARGTRVRDQVLAIARRAFPQHALSDEPNMVNLGQWRVEDVRRLFCMLDALHV